ncbi:12525_t:CDS:2, partial [Funneliformis mosseae]
SCLNDDVQEVATKMNFSSRSWSLSRALRRGSNDHILFIYLSPIVAIDGRKV